MTFFKNKSFIRTFLIICFLLFLPILYFRQYIFQHKVLFPANLLVSYYAPWKYETTPEYPNGPPNKPIGYDNLKLFYPYMKFSIDELKNWKIPFWNPYVFSGNIHLATYQAAVLYPLHFLFLLFPMIDAWSIMVIFQPILASLFMYLFLQSQGLSKLPSFFGSIVYAYSGWMISWWEESLVIIHSIVWLPLALYGSNLLWKEKKQRGLSIIVFALVMSIFAGFLQMTLYLIMTILSWNIYLLFLCQEKVQFNLKYKYHLSVHNFHKILKFISGLVLEFLKMIFEKIKKQRYTILILIVGIICSLLITAPQWLPSFEAYVISPRGSTDVSFLFKDYLMPLSHLITLIAPDYWGNPGTYNYFEGVGFYHEKAIFIGIIPLLFSLLAVLSFFNRNIKQKKINSPYLYLGFWIVFTIITLILGLQTPIGWIWLILKIPILSVAVPSRIFTLFAFGVSVLSAYGLSIYREKPVFKQLILPIFIIFIILIIGGAGYILWMMRENILCLKMIQLSQSYCSKDYIEYIGKILSVSKRNLYIPTFLFGLTICIVYFWKKFHKIAIVFIFICTIFQSVYFSNKYTYFSDRTFVYPSHEALSKLKDLAGINRVWAYGNAYTEKNILSYYGLYSPEGYDALFPKEYGELLTTITTNGTLSKNIARTDADLKPMSEGESFNDNTTRLKLMKLLGVKYVLESKVGEQKDILTDQKRFPDNLFTTVWENSHWKIWEYTQSLPRVFFARSFEFIEDQETLITRLFDPSFSISNTVLLSTPQMALDNNKGSDLTKIEILKYDPTNVEISVNSTSDGYIVLSDEYEQNWKATVNSINTSILKANYSFRAVRIPSGSSIIHMYYDPKFFKFGLVLCCFGFLLFSLIVLSIRYIGKKK
jgi:hypothetical protein